MASATGLPSTLGPMRSQRAAPPGSDELDHQLGHDVDASVRVASPHLVDEAARPGREHRAVETRRCTLTSMPPCRPSLCHFAHQASLCGFAPAGLVVDCDNDECGMRCGGEVEGTSLHAERRGTENSWQSGCTRQDRRRAGPDKGGVDLTPEPRPPAYSPSVRCLRLCVGC